MWREGEGIDRTHAGDVLDDTLLNWSIFEENSAATRCRGDILILLGPMWLGELQMMVEKKTGGDETWNVNQLQWFYVHFLFSLAGRFILATCESKAVG